MTEAGARPALRREDYAWARTDLHRRRVDAALDVIRRAATEHQPIGVSFSGGKDSTCLLDLVRRVVPDAPAAFFDSGCELASTYKIVQRLGVDIIHPRLSALDMARYAGWWGYADPVDPDCPFAVGEVLVVEPSETFVVKRRLRSIAYGVRGEESGGRAQHVRVRAKLGFIWQARDRTWYAMPLARWELRDVWAYIASRELDYNAAYDRMTEARIAREDQRVSTLLGSSGTGFGRFAFLRRAEPERWEELTREFPALRALSG
jgi:phosphoadenosine phosphosulfate reductase